MRIWKQILDIKDIQTIEVPNGAKMLDVQMQNGTLACWYLCDEKNTKVTRNIAIYGTGEPLPYEVGEYIGTFQVQRDSLVFHVFEMI